METTIRINSDQLTIDILEGIKRMFPHKIIDITVQSADIADYMDDNPAYTNEVNERIEAYEARKKVISIKPEDLL